MHATTTFLYSTYKQLRKKKKKIKSDGKMLNLA